MFLVYFFIWKTSVESISTLGDVNVFLESLHLFVGDFYLFVYAGLLSSLFRHHLFPEVRLSSSLCFITMMDKIKFDNL